MKQFLTFLFIWFIPILSNASAKMYPIAGDRVNSLSSKACNCFFFCSHESNVLAANSFDFKVNSNEMQFGNTTGANSVEASGEQWTEITNACLFLFSLLLAIYLILKVLTIRNRIRS